MYMLDTDTCIYIIKKKSPMILERFKRHREEGLHISSITLAELEFGIENNSSAYKEKNRIALLGFLTIFKIVAFDENAAKEYGIVKKQLKDKNCLIGPFDMLIGSQAKSLNMTLVTNNLREFERIENLKLENWM